MQRRYLVALLIASGATGLLYESLWVRLLALSFGNTTLSFSSVLAVFFGGLALGAFIAGRLPRALSRPARTYALLEIATGVAALLIHPLLVRLPDLFAAIDPGAGLAGSIMRFAAAIPILGIPTVLMGATLPMVTAACIHDDEEIMVGTASIYGANTLGACFGAYALPFLLLPALGAFGTTIAAATLNFAIGALVLFAESRRVDVRWEEPAQRETRDADEPATPDPIVRLGLALAFFGGLAAISIQVVWSRLISIFLEGTIYGVSAVLIAVLLGIGLGSLLLTRMSPSATTAARGYVIANLVLATSLALLLYFIPWIHFQLVSFAGGMSGLPLLHAQLALVVVALAIPSAASGVALPLLVRVLEGSARLVPRTLGRLYATNTAGSILGSLIAGFVLLPKLGTEGAWYVTALLVVGMGAVSAVLFDIGPRIVAIGVVAAQVGIFAAFPGFDARLNALPVTRGLDYFGHIKAAQKVVESTAYFHEGEVASVFVHVTQPPQPQLGLRLNGLGQGSWSPMPPHYVAESLLVAQVPYIHTVATPERALIVGIGAGATIDAMLDLGVGHLEVLELEPSVVTALEVIHGKSSRVLTDPRVELIVDDARHHLLVARRTRPHSYDLITSMPAHPWVASSIFTQEFFEIARDNLTEHGVFSTWFGTNRMTPELMDGLFRAFTYAFPNYFVYEINEVGALYLVGSRSPLVLDRERFRAVAARPAVRLHPGEYDTLTYFGSRVLASGDAQTPPLASGVVNDDDSMLVELGAPRTSTSIAARSDLFKQASISPRAIPESQRTETLTEILEDLLGTPMGKLPFRVTKARMPRFKALLALAESDLDPGLVRYFRGRSLILDGKIEDAKAELAAAAASAADPEIATRARVHAALLEKTDAERAAALSSIPATGSDVWIRMITLGAKDRAFELAQSSTRTVERDALAWLMRRSHDPTPLSTEEMSVFVRRVGSALERVDVAEVFELCVEVAERSGAEAIASDCRARSRSAIAQKSDQHKATAIAAGQKKNDALALASFAAAEQLKALDVPAMYLVLGSAVRAGDEKRVRDTVDALLFRRVPMEVIEAHMARSRAEQ